MSYESSLVQTRRRSRAKAAVPPVVRAIPSADRAVPPFSIPNSSYPGVMDSGMDADAMDQAMRARMFARFGRDYENPRAEAEADRIGSRFSGASGVEDLKSRMGAALGADFSGVRFHTGAEASSMAASSQAEAFTSGRDIYLGGPFQAATAAHELVHTIQQGAVQAAAPVMSAPAGAVQYKRWDRVKKGLSLAGRGIGKGAKWLGGKIASGVKSAYTAVKKSHNKALDQYNNYTDDYKDMSKWERFKWVANNPLAWLRGGGKSRQGTEKRNAAKQAVNQAEDEKAAKLSDMWNDKILGDAAGMERPGAQPAQNAGANVPAPEDDATPKTKEEALLFHLVSDATSTYANIKNHQIAKEEGDVDSQIKTGIDATADVLSGVGSITGLTDKVLPGAGIVGNMISGTANTMRAANSFMSAGANSDTQKQLGKRAEKYQDETKELEDRDITELTDEERYKISRQRAMQQGTEAARIRRNEDIVSGVSSSISALGNFGSAIGDVVAPGSGSFIGYAGTGLSVAAKKIGGAVTGKQKKDLRKNTVNQELNLDQRIQDLKGGKQEYLDRLGITKEQAANMSNSEAKHIILKSMGFKSGKRKEAFNQITKNRAKALTKRANAGQDEELQIMRDMHLIRTDDGSGKKKFSAAGVARKLGYETMTAENPFLKKANEQREKKKKEKGA